MSAVQHAQWFPTDNAGKVFASLNSWQLQSTFRVSVTLHEPVQLERLEDALKRTEPRFPLFQMRAKPGFFWYYFEHDPKPSRLLPDSRYPLGESFSGYGRSRPWHIRIFHKTIALDCAHVLTDGSGALTFLNTLIAEYLNYDGPRDPAVGLLDVRAAPREEELANDFANHYRPRLPAIPHPPPALILPLPPDRPGVRHVTCGRVLAAELSQQAKANQVSVGEYLNASYIEALQSSALELAGKPERIKGPIRIDVPVNLRPVYKSSSLRNFFLTVFIEIDPRLGVWTFPEILQSVYHQMRLQRNPKIYEQIISRNVGSERKWFLRHMPLALKNALMPWIFRKWNLRWTTSSLSNLGRMSLPEPLAGQIERYDILPTHPASRSVGCGVIGFGDYINITFNRTAMNAVVERTFFRGLQARGIAVAIESNHDD